MGADFEDDPLLGPASLLFQAPVRPKKAKSQSSRGATRLSGAQIRRIAHRRPEVMVKVTGSARGLRGLKEHLAYITRNGKLTGERENGERIEGVAEVRALAEEWWADGAARRKNTRDTINLILSMPPGTDQTAVADAARAFAQKTFGGNYDYLLAHHKRAAAASPMDRLRQISPCLSLRSNIEGLPDGAQRYVCHHIPPGCSGDVAASGQCRQRSRRLPELVIIWPKYSGRRGSIPSKTERRVALPVTLAVTAENQILKNSQDQNFARFVR